MCSIRLDDTPYLAQKCSVKKQNKGHTWLKYLKIAVLSKCTQLLSINCEKDVHTDAQFTFIWMQQCVAYLHTCRKNKHSLTCMISNHYMTRGLVLCVCTLFVGYGACSGLSKQSSSQETQRSAPDTSVFPINCHPQHSALPHRMKFLHSKSQPDLKSILLSQSCAGHFISMYTRVCFTLKHPTI